ANPVHVGDQRLSSLPFQAAGVRYLTAALRVERALLELDEGTAVIRLDGGETGTRAERLIANEAGWGSPGSESDDSSMAVLGAVRRRGAGSGALALLVHQLLESLIVDREPFLGQ